MCQALRNSKIVFPPDDNELDRIWHEVTGSIEVSLHGVKVWGSIDCTLTAPNECWLESILKSTFMDAKLRLQQQDGLLRQCSGKHVSL